MKIVVTGPFAAGKTTLIQTISEIDVLSTEAGITDATRGQKAATTVAMDFGRITIDADLVLYLFGTPGQQRFEFMWEVLATGMLGYVVLLDATRPQSWSEAAGILTAFRRMSPVPFVVAVNRSTEVEPAAEAALRQRFELGQEVPVVACEATDRESVKQVLLALLYAVADRVQPAPASG